MPCIISWPLVLASVFILNRLFAGGCRKQLAQISFHSVLFSLPCLFRHHTKHSTRWCSFEKHCQMAITSLNWRKKARDSNENKSDGRNPLMIHTGAVSLMASLVLVPSISTWSHLEEVYWMRHQTRFLFHFISYLFAVQKFCVFFLRFREERETNKEWDEKK